MRSTADLTAPARNTKTDPESLAVELKLVRERGYAVAHEEAADDGQQGTGFAVTHTVYP